MRKVLLLVLVASLAGCVSRVEKVDSFQDENFDGEITNVLLLMPSLFPNASEYGRHQLEAQLVRRGITVDTRDDYFRGSERMTKEALLEVVFETEIDGVLLVDLVGQTMDSRGRFSVLGARGSMRDFETEVSFLLSQGGRVPPVYRETQTEVYLRVRLFPEETQRAAWDIILRFSNPGSAFDLIDRASPRIAREVAESGIVRTRSP
ncbi:MAG: hypothetical protein AAGE01_18335 [Pseudomonadota bacterium]